jgi:hypothetical protein
MSVLTNRSVFLTFENTIDSRRHPSDMSEEKSNRKMELLSEAENINNLNEVIFFVSGTLNCKLTDAKRSIIKIIDILRTFQMNPVPYQILISIVEKVEILKFSKELIKEWNKICIKLHDINYYDSLLDPLSKKINEKEIPSIFAFFTDISFKHRTFFLIELFFNHFMK